MNNTPRNINNGTRSIAKREWEKRQAAIRAAKAAEVARLNKAAMAAMAGGIK